MTAQLVQLDDYRPPSANVADLHLNALFNFWRAWAMLVAIPLAIYMRGQR